MDIFHQICRSCNNERKNMLNIFESTLLAKSIHVEEMLSCCIQEPVTIDDKYPKQICYLCAKQLEITYKFLLQYNKSKRQFDQILEYMSKCETDDEQRVCQNESDMVGLTHQYADENENQQQQQLADNSSADDIYYQAFNRKSVNSYINKQNHSNNEDNSIDDIEEVDSNQNKFNSANPLLRKVHLETSSNHKEVETEEIFTKIPCSYCAKSFFTAKALILHQKISHKLKVKSENLHNLCGKCGEVFGSNSLLDKHKKDCFAENLVYNCSICSQAFISSVELEQHIPLCFE